MSDERHAFFDKDVTLSIQSALFLIVSQALFSQAPIGSLYTNLVPTEGPLRIKVDRAGSVYGLSPNRLYKLYPDRAPEPIAGNGSPSFVGDQISATVAGLNNASDFLILSDGGILIADSGNNRIRLVKAGSISTVAGTGSNSPTSFEGAATSISVPGPGALAIGPNNTVLFVDGVKCARLLSSGRILRFAGKCAPATDPGSAITGDGKLANESSIRGVKTLLYDTNSNVLYFSQSSASTVYSIRDNVVYAVASLGEGSPGSQLAIDTKLRIPQWMALDRDGGLYIHDSFDGKFYLVQFPYKPGAAIETLFQQSRVSDFAIAEAGDLYFAYAGGSGREVRRIPNVVRPSPPKIAPNGVVNAANASNSMAPGSWATLFGRYLSASAGEAWNPTGDGTLPAQLKDVRVEWNDRPSAISYISAGQVNVLIPNGLDTSKPATVKILTPRGTDSTYVSLAPFSPAFFHFQSGQRLEVAAVHIDGSLISSQVTASSRPAEAGETISLFGTGFGATLNSLPDLAMASPSLLRNTVTVLIGTYTLTPEFAGVVGPGLVQLNITLPQIPPGCYPISATIGGVKSENGISICIR